MNPFLVTLLPYLLPIAGAYIASVAERTLKIKLDGDARATLDSAMQNGADWVISQGRAPTAEEVLDYTRGAAAAAMKRFDLDGGNAHVAQKRAAAMIVRQVAAKTASPPVRLPAGALKAQNG
jgi:hypothetical protein